jgi:hypothetical protein
LQDSARAGLGLLDDDDVSRQLKTAVFEAELKEKLRQDREKELRFCVALGEDRMTEEEIAGGHWGRMWRRGRFFHFLIVMHSEIPYRL